MTGKGAPADGLVAGVSMRTLRPRVERQPGNRRPAPGALWLVQAFANSRWDLDHELRDEFASTELLAGWLMTRDLLAPGAPVDETDRRRALDAREGLHALLFVNSGVTADHAAIDRLNDTLRGLATYVQLDGRSRPEFVAPRRGVDAALALVGASVAAAQLDGSWSRLKACPGGHCGWAFYDHSRNDSGTWCSMAVCGARAKAREYRRRKHAVATSDRD
jgi:predicted RNA-binding Zn ribbon-like protein